uniref:BID domain-containing protein n=1 Tax=uncultured Jannaschia sp. TaxID=293347 RepID=UPI00262EF950
RVQVTETLREARLWNGNAGVITGIDAETGRITARLDGPGGVSGGGKEPGREVSWRAAEFTGFRHGYAGTIYKGQGKTIDHTYLLHSAHWRQAASYVALTRQRESARVFAATETATDLGQLARQMSRREVRAASIAWATREELPAALRPAVAKSVANSAEAKTGIGPAERPGNAGIEHPSSTETVAPVARTDEHRTETAVPGPLDAAAKSRTGAGSQMQGPTSRSGPQDVAASAPRWLIPPRLIEDRIDPGERAAAVAADPAVQRERDALGQYLAGAYRDPRAARARLGELVATHGATSAARRIEVAPDQLGALAGRTGLLAGRTGRAARAQAERVVQAVGPAVRRIGEAEVAAAQDYTAGIAARRTAEAVGVPVLSVQAQEAVRALGAAATSEARAGAWTSLQADGRVAGELASFVRAVETRLGPDAVRAMDRRGAGVVEDASTRGLGIDRATLGEIGRAVQAVRHGERAAAEGQRLAAGARMRSGPKMRP